MIRLSQTGDLPQIKALWMQAFHDSREATDFYFDTRWREENLLVDVEEGQLRGMLSFLLITLVSGGQSLSARYFFAIATDERYKRQGISTGLIRQAKRLTKMLGGAAAILVPANKELFSFYEKRDFQTFFYYDLLEVEGKDLPSCPPDVTFLPATAHELLRLRDQSQKSSSLYVRWDEDALNFVVRAAEAWEAPLLRFAAGSGEGYAYCEWSGDTLLVKELVLQGISVDTALAILHSQLFAESYSVRLPQGEAGVSGSERCRKPYGMISWLDGEIYSDGTAPYLGFGKD